MLFYTIQDGHGRYNFKHKFDSPVRADTGLHNWLKVSPKSDDINNNISASEYMYSYTSASFNYLSTRLKKKRYIYFCQHPVHQQQFDFSQLTVN